MMEITGEKWKLCHIENTEDLCLMAHTTAAASEIIDKVTEALRPRKDRLAICG